MPITVKGQDELKAMAQKIRFQFSVGVLTEIALQLAREAGDQMLSHTIEQCIQEIYDPPEGEYERTEALKRSHQKVEAEGGFEQIIRIDPTAEAEPTPHVGRALVTDYAVHVHDGYTQKRFGAETGVFVLGRPWFDNAVASYGEAAVEYVLLSFEKLIERMVEKL